MVGLWYITNELLFSGTKNSNYNLTVWRTIKEFELVNTKSADGARSARLTLNCEQVSLPTPGGITSN